VDGTIDFDTISYLLNHTLHLMHHATAKDSGRIKRGPTDDELEGGTDVPGSGGPGPTAANCSAENISAGR